jgi:hypothetical protein
MSDLTRRIFIDSRHRLPTSESNGHFSVDLPWPIHVPTGSMLHVDNVVLSHVWPTVDAANCNLFLKETFGGTTYHRMITLATGQYSIGTLVAELQAKLRSGSYITDGLYTVTHASNRLEVSNSSTTGELYMFSRKDVTGGTTFEINWTFGSTFVQYSTDFNQIWQAATVVSPQLPPSPVADACELVGLMSAGATVQPSVPYKMAHVDLARHKSLYLCCGDLGESTTLNLVGRTDIIKKLDVGHTTQGEVIVQSLSSDLAFSVVRSDTVLKNLNFSIRDYKGDVVQFYDHQVTFQLIITRPTER